MPTNCLLDYPLQITFQRGCGDFWPCERGLKVKFHPPKRSLLFNFSTILFLGGGWEVSTWFWQVPTATSAWIASKWKFSPFRRCSTTCACTVGIQLWSCRSHSQLPTISMVAPGTPRPVKNRPGWEQCWIPVQVSVLIGGCCRTFLMCWRNLLWSKHCLQDKLSQVKQKCVSYPSNPTLQCAWPNLEV